METVVAPYHPTEDQSGPPKRLSLEEIAMLSLEFGKRLMEAGASARHVDEITAQVATGLGADRVDMRVGYASLEITVGIGMRTITRMRRVGSLGVNHSLDLALRELAARIGRRELAAAEAREELGYLAGSTTPHPDWVVALSVGAACAAFGRLTGADWEGVAPIFIAAMLGQLVRRRLAARQGNVFVVTAFVAAVAAALGGIVARLAGSATVGADMVASVLMLVPGVPALNAQNDILEGRPTMGSARAVWVIVILVFITAGLWLAQGLTGVGP